jgi:hypothetical protein
MAQKNSGKIIQMLSPENYIRAKGRSLPLFECRINPNWEEGKQASCIVSRKHSNGNITYCFYHIDLLCFGVKLTHYVFNESMSQYKDFLTKVEEDISLELVDYALVHNVIHAGLEYAEEYEFKPHKDFTKVTQYFLEEDNDDIELMEIECGGDDGQPVYLYSSTMTPTQEQNRIIAQLERTAGPDNYSLIDEDEEFDDDFDDGLDDLEEDYFQNTFEENKEIFIDLYIGLKNSDDPNDLDRLIEVTDSLFQKITDPVLVDQYYDELFDNHVIAVESEKLPCELWGTEPEVEIDGELKELLIDIIGAIYRNLKKAHKKFKEFQIKAGGMPVVAFLELLILQKENPDKYAEALRKYVRKYPDYSLITLMWLTNIYSSENVPEEVTNKVFNLDTLFPGRTSLHFLEMFYYLLFLSNVVAYEENADKMEAFYQLLDEFDLSEDLSKTIENLFSFSRIEYFAKYFNIEIN